MRANRGGDEPLSELKIPGRAYEQERGARPAAVTSAAAAPPSGGWRELRERLVRIRQARSVDRLSGAHELLDRGRHVPDVDVHACDDPATCEPEGNELAAPCVAPD